MQSGALKKTAGLVFIVISLAAPPALAMDNTLTQGGPDLTKARALIKNEDWAAAIKELKRLQIQGLDADVLNALAFSQRNSGDFETAYKNYQRALKIDPNHKGAREYLGELYIQTGRIEEARAQLDILKRLCPEGCQESKDLEKALAAAAPK